MRDSELYIISSPTNAKDFKENHASTHSPKIITTHIGANAVLAKSGIKSFYIDELVDEDFQQNAFDSNISLNSNEILRQIDKDIAEKIADIFEIDKIDFFYTLYRYFLMYLFARRIIFEKALINFIKNNKIKKIFYYEDCNFRLINTLAPIKLILNSLKFDEEIEVDSLENNYKENDLSLHFRRLFRLSRSPSRLFKYIKRRLRESRPLEISSAKKTILFGFPLYDLEWALSNPHFAEKYNMILWPELGIPEIPGQKIEISEDEEKSLEKLFGEYLRKDAGKNCPTNFYTLIKKCLLEDFRQRIKELILPLKWIKEFLKGNNLDLYVWGNSPSNGSKSLICEYIRSKKIKTLGAAHGGNYIIQDCLKIHNASDFSRCDSFITYGANENDFANIYPNKARQCKFIPCGSVKELRLSQNKAQRKKKIDILFPLANIPPFFHGIRISSKMLYDWQIRIFEVLNSFYGIKIIVKPPPDSGISRCPSIMDIGKYKNLKLMNIKLDDCFKKYDVSLVVTEFPSSPLYESIGRDVDIIAMNEPILPIFGNPLELLRKRAHFFNDIESFLDALVKYGKGELPKLRNNEFYEKYVYREDAERRVAEAIENSLG